MSGWLNGRPEQPWEADIIAAARERDRERDLRQLSGVTAGDTQQHPPGDAGPAASLLEPPEALL